MTQDTALSRFKRYPAYKESGVQWLLDEIPAHWECLSLSRVTQSRCDGPFGSGLKSEHYSADGARVVRLQNIGWAEFNDADRVYIDNVYARELGDHRVIAGDLLIAGLGGERNPVGRACVAPAGIDEAIVKADCFRFRLDHSRVLPRFAAYQLSATAMSAAGSLATGATRARMNLTTTAARKVALPGLDEQLSIATFLDVQTARIDALVAKKERLIELLQEKRAALITRAVTKGVDATVPMKDSGIDWLEEIPAHWEVKPLKAFAGLQTGLTLGKNYESRALTMRPYLRVANVQDGYLDLRDVAEVGVPAEEAGRYELRTGDVLLTEGGDFDKLGRGYVWEEQVRACLHQNHIFAVRPRSDVLSSHYLALLMGSAYGRAYFTATSKQSTNLASTNSTKLQNFQMPSPPIEEQREIVVLVAREMAKIDALLGRISNAIDRLKELRTALTFAAVTGKIDVRDEAGEAA